jgi:uncharacterized membrane protein YfcA
MTGETAAIFLALLIGVSLGALGSGGSIVTLPILVYVAGLPPTEAVGMSLAIVGATSLFGCFFHWRQGNFRLRPAVVFGVTGMCGSWFGSMGTHLIPPSALMLMFAAIMLAVGARMALPKPSCVVPHGECRLSVCVPAGFVVGLVTGFLGVGGGFLIVPALVWFAGLDAKKAIGTSLGIIAVNSAAGLAGQLRYAHFDWHLTGEFLAGSMIGMGAGIAVVKRMPERALRRAFAVVVIVVGLAIAWRVLARTAFSNPELSLKPRVSGGD